MKTIRANNLFELKELLNSLPELQLMQPITCCNEQEDFVVTELDI